MTNMPVKKSIAIVIPGGIGTGKDNIGVPVIEHLVRSLATDFSVTVFQLYKTNPDFKADGFDLIDIASRNTIIRIVTFIILFRRHNSVRRFNAVHGFWALPGGLLAVIAGKIFRLKSVVSLLGGDAISLPEIGYGQLQKWLPRKLVLWTLHQADEVISPSRYLIDNLEKVGLRRRNVKYIPLGVDTSKFSFKDKLLTTPVKFIHIAHFNRVKDQRTLLKTFQIIAGKVASHLTIIGEGELENDLRSFAGSLNLTDKVSFVNHVTLDELVTYYHQSNILLHSSLSEGHPMVAQEAMSCGVLVCGTRVGLLQDLTDCCVSVDIRDFQALADAVLKLLDDPARMKELRDRAFKWASEHSMRWTVSELKHIYSTGHDEKE